MKRLLSALTVLVSLCAGALAGAAPATAGVLDVTCTPPSSNLNSYTPPLTGTTRTVTVSTTALYGPCTSLSQPAITSGSRTASFTITASCLDLLDPGTVTYTITWNTGQSSTITSSYTSAVAGAVLTVVATGTVTSGLFAGDSVVTNFTGPATDITLCTLGLGSVSSVYTLGTLEITSV
ncbi:hypothetical protein [Saccharothrix syringae]|uniref:Ig-like domain-containing protein n=1 Tax=Saccharothrix syringae TaxID=103733 RepID=A0A5Q0H597_SACSY|nr:hypothetical protein [Saccharothrix syringae]QFZ20912.1 hypothetical protein EKG83_29150 [Saccharothrix syringae]